MSDKNLYQSLIHRQEITSRQFNLKEMTHMLARKRLKVSLKSLLALFIRTKSQKKIFHPKDSQLITPRIISQMYNLIVTECLRLDLN